MARSKAHASAVYRGHQVKQFSEDLTNYSEIRRGLSARMREQTLSKTELVKIQKGSEQGEKATAKYIETLNLWRTASQAQKAGRAQAGGTEPVEKLFNEVLKSGYVDGADKAIIMAANLKLKTMSKSQAKTELMEALNTHDRTRSSDFYKAVGYLEDDNFDPDLATDSMLREIVVSGFLENSKYSDQAERLIAEYVRRLGEGGEGEYASERSAYISDVAAVAWMIVGK